MTYSIIIRDGKKLGIGVVSGSVAVGSRVPWLKYGVGAVATQGYTNTELGPLILQLLQNYPVKKALELALGGDSGRERRQVGVLDSQGNSAAFTGKETLLHRKHITLKDKVCLGNLLTSEKVVDALCEFSCSNECIEWRILEALERAHEVGGDSRGDRSAALIVVGRDALDDRLIDIRVDYSEEPVKKLREIYEMLSHS